MVQWIRGKIRLARCTLPVLLGAVCIESAVPAMAQQGGGPQFSASVASDIAAIESAKADPAQTAPGTAQRTLRLNVAVRSAADLAGVRAELEAVSDRVTAMGDRVLYVESRRLPELAQALKASTTIEYVESGVTLVLPPERPPRPTNFDVDAQFSHNVPQLRRLYDLSGAGVAAAVWDEGQVLSSHLDFKGRLVVHDTQVKPNAHSTHVAGTIAATGLDRRAEGMAPKAEIHSYDWNGDIGELAEVARSLPVVHVTNHSYGASRGWSYSKMLSAWVWEGDPRISEDEDYLFGKYTLRSQQIDEVIFNNPRLGVFVAAGNKRAPTYNPKLVAGWDGTHLVPALNTYVRRVREPDSQHDGGYDTLEGFGVAKNVITIGAVEDIARNQLKPENVRVTNFSSWGPADDGRIKPDLVANGAQLLAPTVSELGNVYNTRAYAQMSGTSMATPAAAGVAVLLAELSLKKRNAPVRADEMKAILINTAISPTKGPNYRTGWGTIDALAAGKLLTGDGGTVIAATHSGDMKDHVFRLKANGGPISITLTWLDPPALPNKDGLNDRRLDLVHDLDLVVTNPSNVRHYPWSRDWQHPAQLATRGAVNTRDNVEQVDIDQAAAGETWMAAISAPSAAAGVRFAIALRGATVLDKTEP